MQLGPQPVVDTVFVERKYEAPPAIVDVVLGYEALTLITGREGIGKSLLVMQLAYHIASGQEWLGFKVPQPHKVLLIQKELPDAELQARFRAQLAGRAATGLLYFVEMAGGIRLAPDGLNWPPLNYWIDTEKPHVIIIDPLAEFNVGNENAANEMVAGVLRPIERWKAAGASIVLVHHHGKPNEEAPRTGTSLVRGSSALTGSTDTNIQLIEINRDKGWYQLDFAKLRRTAPHRPIALVRDPDTLTYALRGAHISILDALRQMGGEVPQRDLVAWAVANLEVREVTAYKAIERLEADGAVVIVPSTIGRGNTIRLTGT